MTIHKVVQHYFPKSEIININRPKGGISADLTIIELRSDSGPKKIVIRQIETASNEFKLLKTLQTAGAATPVPLFLDESCTHLPKPFLILTHIDGQVLYQFDDRVKAGSEIGTQLGKIHSIHADQFELSFIPAADLSLPKSEGHPLEEAILNVLEPVWPMMQVDSTVLLHGDFWPGNLVWEESRLIGVIDWEDARLGNPLQDLAISRFDSLFIFGHDAMQALTDSYFKISNFNASKLPYWDLFAALRAIPGIPEWAAGWPELGRADLTEEAIWKSLRWFIKQTKAKII